MGEDVKTGCASMEWLDGLKDGMFQAPNLGSCITLGATWLCEWIDQEMAAEGAVATTLSDYCDFCTSMAEEMESWRGEDEELWAWSWGMAAEMLDLYERSGQLTEQQLIKKVTDEIDEVDIGEREPYARHLFMSALSVIHGWAAASAAEESEGQ